MRSLKMVLLLVLVFSSLTLTQHATWASAAAKPSIKVIVDGTELTLAVKPIEVKGSIMLHAKGAFDALKITSKFEKKKITVQHRGITFKAEVDQSRVYIGKRVLSLTQSPILREGRIYVPARFISAVLDKSVKYEPKTGQLLFGLTEKDYATLLRNLFEAAIKGDAIAIANLIKRGADPNGKMIDEYLDHSPLYYAVTNNRTEAARALLAGGAKLDESGQLGYTAISCQNAELLKLLLEAGLDPNQSLHTGTLLELASSVIGISEEGGESRHQYPSPDVVNTLLDYGADPGIDNSLYDAVRAQNYSIIQYLLRAGADPYKMNRYGDTPYLLSVRNNINRWLVIQDVRAMLPSLNITDANGQPAEQGYLYLRSKDAFYESAFSVEWSAGQLHLDIPNGSYQIQHVTAEGKTYITPPSSSIQIQGETAEPNQITLPEQNVRVALTSDAVSIDGGYVTLYSNTYGVVSVEVNGSSFSLYAPSGQYRIIGYRDPSNTSYPLEGYFTVTSTAGIQELSVLLQKHESQ